MLFKGRRIIAPQHRLTQKHCAHSYVCLVPAYWFFLFFQYFFLLLSPFPPFKLNWISFYLFSHDDIVNWGLTRNSCQEWSAIMQLRSFVVKKHFIKSKLILLMFFHWIRVLLLPYIVTKCLTKNMLFRLDWCDSGFANSKTDWKCLVTAYNFSCLQPL